MQLQPGHICSYEPSVSPLSRSGQVIAGLQVQLGSGYNYPGTPSGSWGSGSVLREPNILV